MDKIRIRKSFYFPGKNKVILYVILLLALLLPASLLACDTPADETAALAGVGSVIAGLAGVYICFIVILWLAGIFLFVMWIITLVDCAKRKNENFPSPGENTKLVWILVIVFAGGIGALIYFFMVMKNNSKQKPKEIQATAEEVKTTVVEDKTQAEKLQDQEATGQSGESEKKE